MISPKTTSLIQPKDQLITAKFKNLYTRELFIRCFEVSNATNIILRKFWKKECIITVAISLIIKKFNKSNNKKITMAQRAWRKLCQSCVAEETSKKTHLLVEDIFTNLESFNLEVEQKDIDELLEIYDKELFSGDIKYFFHEKCDKRT